MVKDDDMVAHLLQFGISNDEGFGNPLFDEIVISTRSFEDGPESVKYILSRKVGSRILHREYSDGSGDVMYEFETTAPLNQMAGHNQLLHLIERALGE